MKRTLSLLLALVMVISMIPAVFAETTDDSEVDFEELLCKHIKKKYTDNGDGTHTVTCPDCDEFEPINEKHTYTDGVCVCDAKSGPVQMPTVGITIAGLVLKDYIGLQLALNKTTMNGGNYDKAYYTFVQKNPDGSVAESGTITFNMATGNYVGAEIPVMAWSMADTYEVTVFWEADGVTYQGATTTTSIKAQAMSRINKNQNYDLCIAMLNYGASVQDTFNHNDADASYLANYDLTAEQKALPTFDELTLTEQIVIPEGDLKPATKGLSAKDKIILQFAVKNKDLSGCEVRYTLDGGNEIVIPYSEFMSMTAGGSTYTGPKFALTPRQMRSEIKLAFHNAATGEKVYGDIICSVAAFAKDHKGKTTESVIIAMMVYGDAALAAFGK